MADSMTQKELQGLSSDDEHSYEASPLPVDQKLSKFLENFTTQLHYSQPESPGKLWVFWSQNKLSQNDPSSGNPGLVFDIPDPWVIHEKIKSAFSDVELCSFDGLLQFWSPVKTGGRQLLRTYDQPFALKDINSGLHKYRLCSVKYQYNINFETDEAGEDPMDISGAPADAFRNHMAEVFMDPRDHRESPLVRSALECELMPYFVLPICDTSQSCCVGVVECSAKALDDPLEIFNDMNSALKRVGLSTFHVQECLPYKIIHGLKRVADEIEEALVRACQSHDLTLAQVWITYDDETHVPSSSSLEDTHTKRMSALKLIGPKDRNLSSFKDYYDTCDMLPLKIGKGLARKTLQNYEPHFYRNISKMSDNELLGFPSTISEHSCLVICLRSIETGDLDYAFEILWPQSRNYFILLESLIFTLKGWLPSFKFASGEKLGDELRVLHVGNSTESGIGEFKIFQGKKLSPIPKALEVPMQVKCKTTEKKNTSRNHRTTIWKNHERSCKKP